MNAVMGKRIPLNTADEYDTFGSGGKWRKYLCYLSKAGATSGVKRRYRRRERRTAKHEIRREEDVP